MGLLLLAIGLTARADDFAGLCADRAAVERVYYLHRLGDKPPFEQVLPPAAVSNLVQLDLRKETALKQAYGVEVTSALLAAEVQRINATTRAPEMLVEIKAALGSDPEKFARTFAQPRLVERLLRERFENDDARHASVREQAERSRAALLSARTNGADYAGLRAELEQSTSNAVVEITWLLGTRPAELKAPTIEAVEIQRRFGPEAKLLSAPVSAGRDGKNYFVDLPDALQRVLRVQLRQPGDLSAVIELPHEFLLYLCRERTEEHLSAALLSLPKPRLEDWLHQQPGGAK